MALADNKAKIQALLAGINTLPEAKDEPVLQEKAVTPTEEAQTVAPDTGYDGLSKVDVGAIPDEYIVPTGTVSITENGTHNVREVESVNVSVDAPEPALQEKTVSPATSQQTVTPDSDYDGLSQVTVSAMPTATQATPSISLSSAGVITASATQTAGYVTAGTKSATKQLTTQAAKTVTPGTSDQTAVSSGVYTTGAVKVRGDANLLAENIRSGVSIFDVLGTFEGEGSGSAGLPEGVSAMAYGTLVPAADGNSISFDHNLGVRPDFCVWWLDDAHSVESGGALRGSLTHSTVDAETFNVGYISVGYKTGGTFDLSTGSIQGMFYMNATRISCFCSSNTPFKAGYTYHWIAGVLDTAL